MYAALYAEVNLFCIMILLLLLWRSCIGADLQKNRKLFVWVLCVNALLFLLDLLWILTDAQLLSLPRAFNYWINVLYYCVSGASGYCWFQYAETVLDSPVAARRRWRLVSALPMAALVVLALLSSRPGLLFYIDDNNMYHRDRLYVLQGVIAYGYLLAASLHALLRARQPEEYAHRQEYRVLASFAVFPVIFGAMQVALEGMPLLCIGITLSLLWVYFDFQERRISLDPLTQLNNRNQLMKHIAGKLRHKPEDRELYLLMMDVDSFKKVNDRFGHVEGDRALMRVADALKRACQKDSSFIARYGGDEFTIVCEARDQRDVQALCSRIREALAAGAGKNDPYRLSLSIGYAKYTEALTSVQEWIHVADEELYRAKKALRK